MWRRESCGCARQNEIRLGHFRGRAMSDFSAQNPFPIWLLGFFMVGVESLNPHPLHAGLYECRIESGAPIYTDSPAQLERCQPVASGGTTRLGLVGGAHPSSSQPTPAAVPEPVASFPPPPIPMTIQPDAGPSPNALSDEPVPPSPIQQDFR